MAADSESSQQEHTSKPSAAKCAPYTGLMVLCFFLPLVGLILYLKWFNTQPARAKAAGNSASMGVLVYFICVSLVVLIIAALIH